ncbi:MAG TPA: hypothetical protein VE650_13710 [Acetobacteraceae bacterium]|nr:hypothetical protein [Acetobacteraceae bacterium]
MSTRHPLILNASTSLLGICFVIITGLKLSDSNRLSWADEITWVSSVFFLASIVLSYASIRNEGASRWYEAWAERVFMVGVAGLTLAVFVMAVFIEVGPYPTPRVSAQPSVTQASPTSAPAATSVR